MNENEVYIISYARTPIGKFGGKLRDYHPSDLGSIVIKEVLKRGRLDPSKVDIVIMGNVLRAGHGQDLARQAAIKAGISYETDAYSVDMVCSSGMMSVINGVQSIRTGDSNIVVAGGMESMSKAGFLLSSELRWGVKMLMNRSLNLVDTMFVDGLTDPFNFKLMGMEADMVAKTHDISRRELDEIAFESHMRAYRAKRQGIFKNEIVEVPLSSNEVFADDEGIREDTDMEKLSKLPPAFSNDGLHTAGNSSQISDGASALLLASERAVKELSLKPIARVIGYTWVGIESWRFPEAPIYAIKKLLSKLGMRISDFDYFENNEAFAVNSVLLKKYLGIELDKLNIYGGAIALGHPIGASGARIIVTLLNVLKRNKGKKGIASICHGIGGATAIAVEVI